MNVSKKVLVIIYVIFALLTSVIIFASQNILYSSFSEMEEKEASSNVEKMKNAIESQVLELDKFNSVLSSREDVRAFVLDQNPENLDKMAFNDVFSLCGYDFIFFLNSSGDIVYSEIPGSENPGNSFALTEIHQNLNDSFPLSTPPGAPLKGLLLLESGPVIVSSRPVYAAPTGREVTGTIILGKDLDSGFIESIRNATGHSMILYGPDSVPSDLQQAFFENRGKIFTHFVEEGKVAGYYVLKDITGNSAVMIRADTDRNTYAQGQKALRYIVLFLLFSGMLVGAGCKLLLDREVVSRIVAIDSFVENVGKDEAFSEQFFMDGDDELSRLTEGINRMLARLKTNSDEFKALEHEKNVILNSLSELVVFLDPELRIIWANEAFLAYMGLRLEDIVGRHYEEVSILCHESSFKSPVQKTLESGNEELEEITAPDGKVWMIRADLIKDEKSRVTGVLQTGLDITAHKRSEEKLLQAKLGAEVASRTKSEFLANMSHELRTPLNSIIGFSDILHEQVFGDLNERQLKYVKNISTSGNHLLELINDILDLSKVEAGKMDLHYSEFLISSVFEDVKNILSPLAQAKSLELTFNVEPGFMSLEADRSRLIQILYNLVSNAVKFTPEGGKISVSCKKSGSRALISVADTGIGISSEDQKKLFQPFTQLDASTSRKYCGTGLGLALVKKIVNIHQGDIWVESDLGKGSTFTFAIPLIKPSHPRKAEDIGFEEVVMEFEINKAAALSVKADMVSLQDEVELPEIHSPEKGSEKERLVLVVDDDKNSSELLSFVLGEAGYSVAPLYNGRNVLQVAKKLKPEVITLDVFLPDTNGWLVLKQLKNDPDTSSIPVLIISMTDNNELGIALGAMYSFTKPVKRAELVGSLEEITNRFGFEKPRVLIVDDDENAVELLNSMIEPEGFEVVTAYGGEEGLKMLFSEQRPDILILDLMMPEVSGFEVITRLREDARTRDIPLIVCTSGEFTEKNIEELNGELKEHLIAIMKKGTFGRKELITRIKQLAMLKRQKDEKNSNS